MAGVYTVEFENELIATASGDHDFFEVTPADDKPLTIHAIFLTQLTSEGDTNEDFHRVKIIRGHATTGNGTGVTPAPLNPSDAGASFTAKVVGSTIASGGTPIDLHSETYNIRTGWMYLPTPEMRPKVNQGQTTLVVRLMAATEADIYMSGTMYVEEE